MDKKLFERVVHFIKPFVDDAQRESYVREALYGEAILEHIKWDSSSPLSVFAANLVDTIDKKGERNDLCKLITGLSKNAGSEQQNIAEALCQEVRASVPSFFPGFKINGRYSLLEKLGAGENGEVWKANESLPDENITRTVSLKLLRREFSYDRNRINLFKREISLAIRLAHPNVIRTIHWGEFDGYFYTVMDFIEGQTLQELMVGKKFSPEEIVNYLGQISDALNSAHQLNLVHGNVKPENIIVKEEIAYIKDFGLSIPLFDTDITEDGSLHESNKYKAPEQVISKRALPQSDVYSLGILAYVMLAGIYPFESSNPSGNFLSGELPVNPNIPNELHHILTQATALNPQERYPSTIEFITELSHWELDPAKVETEIAKYLDALTLRIRGEVYENLFVNLGGDIRKSISSSRSMTPEDTLIDPYLESILNDFAINLSAQERKPTTLDTKFVPNILEYLANCERVVLLGEPGAGKSFILRRLVMHYLKHKKSLIPVFIGLNEFKGENGETFVDFIKQKMGTLGVHYGQLMRESRLTFICDALNEMPKHSADDRNLIKEVRETLVKIPNFVISCRVRDYQNDLNELNVEQLEIRDMDLPSVKEFIHKYLREEGDNFWNRIGGSDNLLLFWNEVADRNEHSRFWKEDQEMPNYTSPQADKAWLHMWQGAKLIPLARNPYLARVICSLHRRDLIPNNRADLYQAFVTDLYERELASASSRGQSFPEKMDFEDFLIRLANRMQAAHTTNLNLENEDDSLLQAALDATILTKQGSRVQFTHQLLQEYFVVKGLASKMEAQEDSRPLLGKEWWRLNLWRETALMLSEFTGDVEGVARWIGKASPELAIETIQKIGQNDEIKAISHETRQSLIKAARQKSKEVNPLGRASAYRALGLLNADERVGVNVIVQSGSIIPKIDWCEVPRGYFIYGGDSEAFQSADEEEIFLETFYIARYPVTYIQFQAFIEDSEGIRDDRWWEGLAHEYRKPFQQEWPISNHPRENVNWYQAIAFCRWFSSKLEGKIDLNRVMEWPVRLPTEKEWEKAARGTTGLLYPYGNKFNELFCNTRETGIQQTTAVGIFPHGSSPFEVFDMSGNVWDWCLTEFRSGLNSDLTNNKSRVLRGGSWYHDANDARTADRDLGDPSDSYYGFGFRLCTSSLSFIKNPILGDSENGVAS